ncbi:MAG: DUF2232 domain-containing protein [Syntrophales bacterium]|nr:DUF2232 domain-containing protein [Syntrophales bacterium]
MSFIKGRFRKWIQTLKEGRSKILKREFSRGIIISSFVFLAVATTPVLGSIGLIFIPLPVLYYYSKLGRTQGLVVFVVSLLVLTISYQFWNLEVSLPFFFLLGSLGLILSEILRKSCSIEKTVLYSTIALSTLCFALLIYYNVKTGKTPWGLIEFYISESIRENIRLYSQLDISSEQINLIKENANQIIAVIISLFPALVLISTSFIVWLNILAGKLIFQKVGMWYPDFGDLAYWKAPDWMIWFVIISGGLLLISVGMIKIVALNLLIIFLFIYMFQGLAIISFFFKKKNVPGFLRIICYFLIFGQQFLLLLVVGLGLFDIWFNFRKLDKKMKCHTA